MRKAVASQLTEHIKHPVQDDEQHRNAHSERAIHELLSFINKT
jgi:hypothetical protein